MVERKLTNLFEIPGSLLAIVYSLLIASNTGSEILAFWLLLISSTLFGIWAVIDRRWTFFALQIVYFVSALIGFISGANFIECEIQK